MEKKNNERDNKKKDMNEGVDLLFFLKCKQNTEILNI
jgi:hypothetical protein